MAPSSPDDSSSGETKFPRRFGPYVLVTHLGEGGMGRVYLGLRNADGGEQLCVIKRFGNPRAQYSPDQILENQERFRREAEITMALDHPCIARTFNSVHEGSQPYLVQEFVKGKTLESLTSCLTNGKEHYAIPLAVHIVSQIAHALAYVHDFRSLGLVHRDLTPTNVMFADSGEVKVIDFGIAKATLLDDSLTQPHIVVGKPLWTAPEVVTGDKPDRRADLYALGLLFWHLLTGHDPTGYLAKVIAPLPPPSKFNPEVPTQLDGIVAKAVQVDPNRRFQTAADLLGVVSPLVPAGYQGSKELAHQLFRFRSPLADEGFADDIARARPLLEQAEPSRARLKMVLALLLSIAAMVALGFPLVRRFPRYHAEQPAPAQTAEPVAGPQPPTALPEPPPEPAHQPSAAPPAPLPPHPATQPVYSAVSPRAKAARESKPQPAAPQQTADELLVSALDSFDRSDIAKALSLARLAAERGAGAQAFVLISGCLYLKKDYSGAKEALEHALRLAPDNAEAKRGLEKIRRRTLDDTP
jgi:serine/threonine protein kinase